MMNRNCTVLLTLVLLGTFDYQTAGELIMKPRDTDVRVNDSIYFNCSTDLGSRAMFWFHGKKYIYVGSAILEPYQERFKVERMVWNGTFIYNLVIHSVKPVDAGEITCAEDEGFGEKYSVQLVVLENEPVCRSNRELNEIIGQNTCNIEADEVELECSVTYHGNIPPQIEWKKVGEKSLTPLDVSIVTYNNHLISTLKLRGDIALNSTTYLCESNRTTQQPYKCTSKVMKILYALSGNFTVNKTTDDEIHCSANTSQSCSYKWRWLQDNDFTVESTTTVLKATKPGWHRCEAECLIRNKTCSLLVMRAMVFGQPKTESRQTRNIIISVVVTVVVTIVVICVLFWVVVFRDEISAYCADSDCCSTRLDEEHVLDDLLKKDLPIVRGLTVLHEEVFILRYQCQYIEIYDSTKLLFKRRMRVEGLTNPGNIVSCSVNNCLYAPDCSNHEPILSTILKIDPINGRVTKAWEIRGRCGTLSVAGDTNVILCPGNEANLYEYTAYGELIRSIYLGGYPHGRVNEDIVAAHAVKLNNGLFVVCQGNPSGIYLLSTKEGSRTSGRIDEVETLTKLNANRSFKYPQYLSMDKQGSILVTDTYDCRVVLLLGPNFKIARTIISQEDGVVIPPITCFDKSTDKWFATDGQSILVWLEDRRVDGKVYDLIGLEDIQNELICDATAPEL